MWTDWKRGKNCRHSPVRSTTNNDSISHTVTLAFGCPLTIAMGDTDPERQGLWYGHISFPSDECLFCLPFISSEACMTDKFKHGFPVSLRSPAGSGRLTGQSSPLFNFDWVYVLGQPVDTLMHYVWKGTVKVIILACFFTIFITLSHWVLCGGCVWECDSAFRHCFHKCVHKLFYLLLKMFKICAPTVVS